MVAGSTGAGIRVPAPPARRAPAPPCSRARPSGDSRSPSWRSPGRCRVSGPPDTEPRPIAPSAEPVTVALGRDAAPDATPARRGAASRGTRSVARMWRRRVPAEPPPAAEVTANADTHAPEVKIRAFRIGFVGPIGALPALLLGGVVGQLGT